MIYSIKYNAHYIMYNNGVYTIYNFTNPQLYTEVFDSKLSKNVNK